MPAHSQPKKENLDIAFSIKKSDSLIQLVNASPDDSLKIKRLLEVSAMQQPPNIITKDFAVQALAIAQKIKYRKGIMLANAELGMVYQKNNEYQSSISLFKKAITLSESGGFTREGEDYYSSLLNLYFYIGDYPNAMETINQEMLLSKKTYDKNRIAHCDNILGYVNFKQENFEAAESFYYQYINLASEMNDSLMLAHALGELSDVYTGEKKYQQAIDILFKTINLCNRFLAAPEMVRLQGFLRQYKTKAYYRVGNIYKLMGEYNLAKQYALEAVGNTSYQPTQKYEIARFYISAGDIFYRLKEFYKARNFLRYGYNLAREIQHRENSRDAAEYLSQTYAALNRYDSAFYFHQVYTGLKDSIVNNETKMKIAGIQGLYDIAERDKEIARQQEVGYILLFSLIISFIFLLLLYNSYNLKQKNKYQQIINKQQNEVFNTIVFTQEQERKRIAQDIHDSLGSVLSAAKLKLSALEECKKLLSPVQMQQYQESLDLLDEASTELRNISHNIMPATLSKLGLVAALQSLIDKIQAHSGIRIIFIAHGFQNRIDENTEIGIYRIILELINNIVKHAAAKKANIQIIKYTGYINLIIEDDGCGFDYKKALEEKNGIGLGNVLSRVNYLNGSVEVDSSTGKGTTVIIELPC